MELTEHLATDSLHEYFYLALNGSMLINVVLFKHIISLLIRAHAQNYLITSWEVMRLINPTRSSNTPGE